MAAEGAATGGRDAHPPRKTDEITRQPIMVFTALTP
jgi:hypothetical protein